MKVWIDAQLSPSIATWLAATFGVEATPVRGLQLRDATDREAFLAARAAGAVVLTKDADFVRLLDQHGAPPRIVWLTCGNTSNARLREILATAWPKAADLLARGDPLVEIAGPR